MTHINPMKTQANELRSLKSWSALLALMLLGLSTALAAPRAPTGLTATAGDGQVSLTWKASAGATSYNVKRATVSGGPYTTIANVTTTSYTDTGLVNGTTYCYVVSALNSTGESANSSEACATPTASAGGATIENSDLKVTVFATTGMIEVYDKANGHAWKTRTNTSHSAFSNVTIGIGKITFTTTFTANSALVCTVEVILSGRKVTLTCDASATAAINAFDFIEPWQATSSMEYFLGEFTHGVIRGVGNNSWPYNLDNTIGVQNFSMPWIGVFDAATGKGYSVVWETAADAAVKMAAFNSIRTPLTHWRAEKGKFGYKRQLSYNFTASGGYVALAKDYRNNYAGPQGLLVKLSSKATGNANITKLYGAALIWDLVSLIADEELAAMGVQKAVHHADWKTGGRADGINYANNLGYITSEYDYHTAGPIDEKDHLYVDYSHEYHIKSLDLARKADGTHYDMGSGWGLRCSADFLEEGQRIIPPRLLEAPCTARYIDQMTQNIWGHDSSDGHTAECFDATHSRTRSAWVADCYGFYDYLKTLGLITGAELGKYYQVPNNDIFYGMQTHWWPWDFGFPTRWGEGSSKTTWDFWERDNLNPAKRVPLWELVFHDCAIGSLYPWDSIDACYKLSENELRIQGVKDAHHILNGAPPLFLAVDTPDSFGYSPWNAGDATKPYRYRWLQSYRNVSHGHKYLADKEMTGHRWLTSDRKVQESTWSDGSTNIVNFSTSDYTAHGNLLKRNGFYSKGSWGSSIKAYDSSLGREITKLQSSGFYFDDVQVSTSAVPLALWQKASNLIRAAVDRNCSSASFVIKPLLVQSTWNFSTTKVYRVDVATNTRGSEVPWTLEGTDGIKVSGLSGWVALDVVN